MNTKPARTSLTMRLPQWCALTDRHLLFSTDPFSRASNAEAGRLWGDRRTGEFSTETDRMAYSPDGDQRSSNSNALAQSLLLIFSRIDCNDWMSEGRKGTAAPFGVGEGTNRCAISMQSSEMPVPA